MLNKYPFIIKEIASCTLEDDVDTDADPCDIDSLASKYPNGSWQAHPAITPAIVKANPQIQWDYGWLSSNPNISYKDDVLACPDKWYYIYLSSNPAIKWQDVKEDPNKPWNTQELSCNPSITYSDV